MNRKILASVIVLLLCLFILGFGGWYQYAAGKAQGIPGSSTQVTLAEGIGGSGVAKTLEDMGVIDSPLAFIIYGNLSKQGDKLQAGEYEIPTGLSIREILDLIAQGGVQEREVTVTIIEGSTMQQAIGTLHDAGVECQLGDFEGVTSEGFPTDADSFIYEGKPKNASLEGYLFPDTYHFFRDDSPDVIVAKMVNNLEDRITPAMKEQIEASDLNFYEILTLASIIEKEVRTPEERRIAAGIFLQRLEDNYPLQSDATVNYVTGGTSTRLDAEDLAIESKYNTYKHAGLPPTPISNPGLDAIKAVLEAEETDYYFFLTTPDGEAVFSKTYEEHLRNKNLYY